jgi:hypothetical protein
VASPATPQINTIEIRPKTLRFQMLKKTLYFVFIPTMFGFLGCSTDMDRLDNVCKDIQSASLMTDDCERMAKTLKPATEKFQSMLDKLNTTVPNESEREQYISKVSTCMRYYLEIETGTCGSHKAIQPILNSTQH